MKKSKELMKFHDCVKTMNKDRKKYYKKYYKKHKKEVCLKLKYWRQWKKKKEELATQLFNGIEASIEQAQFCLEQKNIDWTFDFLKQAKKEVNKLWEMIKKGVFDKCIN